MSTTFNLREKTSAYYTKYQSCNQNMQNQLKKNSSPWPYFFFYSWPFFWKSSYNIVQYGRIVPTEASKPEHHHLIPSYSSFTACAAQQWIASPGERMAAAGLLAQNTLSELHFMSFYFPINPRKDEATNRLCFSWKMSSI